MSQSHAKHNKDACELLLKNGRFNDWVITTAFYSALHFMHSELFPNQYEGNSNGDLRTFNSFDEYYNHLRPNKTKHGFLLEMVENNIEDEEVIDAFTMLKEICWTARYANYQQTSEVAKESYSGLNLIEEYCTN